MQYFLHKMRRQKKVTTPIFELVSDHIKRESDQRANWLLEPGDAVPYSVIPLHTHLLTHIKTRSNVLQVSHRNLERDIDICILYLMCPHDGTKSQT